MLDSQRRQASTDPVRLGLLVAPAFPERVATGLDLTLPGDLEARFGNGWTWDVVIELDALVANDQGSSELLDVAEGYRRREGWQFAVCLTDLPLRQNGRPVIADTSVARKAGIVSLPALGMVRLHHRVRAAIVDVVDDLVNEDIAAGRSTRISGRRISPPDPDIDGRFVASVVLGNIQLITGLVRDNQPGRLMLGLSGSLAAAFATAALSGINSQVWQIGYELSPLRQTGLTIGSIALLGGWLIFVHHLWERRGQQRDPERIVLYNVTTVLTLLSGIVSMYAILFIMILAAFMYIVSPGILESNVGHPVHWSTFVRITWFTTSAAVLGGALGSSLESNDAVRNAAFGHRQRYRSQTAASPSDTARSDSASDGRQDGA